jgi:hypothetical protein
MPSVRLTIIVRLDQAASLNRLEHFREERQTPIGTDVSVLLSAADGLDATELFSDLGALAIPFEAAATIGDIHYLVAGDRNQMSVVEAGHLHRGSGRPAAASRWLRRRKPPAAIRMALRFPGPGACGDELSSGMMLSWLASAADLLISARSF